MKERDERGEGLPRRAAVPVSPCRLPHRPPPARRSAGPGRARWWPSPAARARRRLFSQPHLFSTYPLFPSLQAIIDSKVLCVHGGLSPDLRTLDQVRTIERVCEIPHEGPFCDLVWSDPEDVDAWAVSPRGAGWLFGARVTAEFNRINGLDLVCRAHQLVQEGLKYSFDDRSLVTVWSAPNYCYRCGNVAAVLAFGEGPGLEREVKYFTETQENMRLGNSQRSAVPYFL